MRKILQFPSPFSQLRMVSMFDGKRTDRFRFPTQIGFDSHMGSTIRRRAVKKDRSIEKQIVHLLREGILADPEFAGNEDERRLLHTTAQEDTLPFAENEAKHGAAPKNTSAHADAQKRRA